MGVTRAIMVAVTQVVNVLGDDTANFTAEVFFKDVTTGNAANETLTVNLDLGATQASRKTAFENAIIAHGAAIGFPGLTNTTVMIFDWV